MDTSATEDAASRRPAWPENTGLRRGSGLGREDVPVVGISLLTLVLASCGDDGEQAALVVSAASSMTESDPK